MPIKPELDAGDIRHRLEILEPPDPNTGTRDASGELIDPEKKIGEVWASLEPIAGREYTYAEQVTAETSHVIKIRYIAGLNPAHIFRKKYTQRRFHILRMFNVEERNISWLIMAIEYAVYGQKVEGNRG